MGSVWRAIAGYFFLILMVRIAGRRPGKQLTPFEFVLIFYMGGMVLTGLVGADHSMVNAVAVILTVAMTHGALAFLKQKSPQIGRLMDGTPLLLMEKNKFDSDIMRRMSFQQDDIMASARDKGLHELEQIDYAVLERNGEISIIRAPEPGVARQ